MDPNNPTHMEFCNLVSDFIAKHPKNQEWLADEAQIALSTITR